MSHINLITPSRPGRSSRCFALSILFSVLLHVAVVLLLPLVPDRPVDSNRQPTIVKLVDLKDLPVIRPDNRQDKPAEYEIDQTPPAEKPLTPVESQRKAAFDQQVEKETTLKGEDVRDQSKAAVQQEKLPSPTATPKARPEQSPSQQRVDRPAPQTQPEPLAKTAEPGDKPILPELTTEQLLPSQETLSRIVQGSGSETDRVKQRDDVEIGDTVWLNLQNDLLVSFFRRFHTQIEMVWNYPPEALEKNEQGTLLLEIIVDKRGELIDVLPRKSSGSDILDYEAIQAVYRAAPFGELTSHYPHEQLKIMAYFSYRLGGKYIYGKR